MRYILVALLLAAVASALPLPAPPQQLVLQGFKPVQSDVAAGREVLADIIFHTSEPTDAPVWISISSNNTVAPGTATSVALCHFASSCPLPAGSHTIRVPVLLPRASAPGSYVISVYSHKPSVSSETSALSIAARVHETLRVRGCAPCGTVLAYTRNGTPSMRREPQHHPPDLTPSLSQFFPTAMIRALGTGAFPPPPLPSTTAHAFTFRIPSAAATAGQLGVFSMPCISFSILPP